jgi:hypothetical protein
VLTGLDGDDAPRRGLDGKSHRRLVDRDDLLDVEGSIGQALPRPTPGGESHQPSMIRSTQPSETARVRGRTGRPAVNAYMLNWRGIPNNVWRLPELTLDQIVTYTGDCIY